MVKLRLWGKKFVQAVTVVFLATLVVDSCVYAQATPQTQPTMPTSVALPPTDADIRALEDLIYRYKLVSRFYNLPPSSFVVGRNMFEPILMSVLNYFDELIDAGNNQAIRAEDAAVIQRFRGMYTAKYKAFRALFDYGNVASSANKQPLFNSSLRTNANTPAPINSALLFTHSPCFYPTFLPANSTNVILLRALAKKYDAVLPPSQSSATSVLLENRPIARHEFAAALDPILEKAVARFKTNPELVSVEDRASLQQLYDDYVIELTPTVLLGTHTKLYTYCQN